jgi:hypothetical protein
MSDGPTTQALIDRLTSLSTRWGENYAVSTTELQHLLRAAADALRSLPPTLAEFCVCAAVQFADGRIVRGHRHDSCFVTADGWTPKPPREHVQGFITTRNRFVDRTEGAALHNAAGICSAHTGKPVNGELFSEDLYFDAHDHVAWNRPYQEPTAAEAEVARLTQGRDTAQLDPAVEAQLQREISGALQERREIYEQAPATDRSEQGRWSYRAQCNAAHLADLVQRLSPLRAEVARLTQARDTLRQRFKELADSVGEHTSALAVADEIDEILGSAADGALGPERS